MYASTCRRAPERGLSPHTLNRGVAPQRRPGLTPWARVMMGRISVRALTESGQRVFKPLPCGWPRTNELKRQEVNEREKQQQIYTAAFRSKALPEITLPMALSVVNMGNI